MNVYKVTFEMLYEPKDIRIPLFFHPVYHVEARNVEEAIERANYAFNSHPDNVDLNREIVEVKSISRPEDESSIVKLEE